MNDMKNTAKKDGRRYKYGSLSVVFTVVFLALIIAVNLVFSSLSLSGDLTVDLTQEDFTSIGEESTKILSELGKDLDITIYFMSARDRYDMDTNTYNGVNLTAIVRDMAENFAKQFDGSGEIGTIKVEYKELNTDPAFENKYLEESTTMLSGTSVIIQGKYHYRVLDLQSFFTLDENGKYYSFNGEYRFTTAMLQSSISEPQVVSITYGHGEPVEQNGGIALTSDLAGVVSIFGSAGFEIKTVDLRREEIDPRTEILVCYDPKTDFESSEIDKISEYLDNHNSLMVFVDSETEELKELKSYMSDSWGIDYKPLHKITDETHSLGSVNVINAKYPEFDGEDAKNTAAYMINKTVKETDGVFTTAMPNSVELFKRDGITQDNFAVETVLSTFDTAYSSTVFGKETEGEIPLMLLSSKFDYGENNVSEYSYVMLVGSTEFANTQNLTKGSYGNDRVLLATARVFAVNRVAPDVADKPFGSTALTIETGTARTLSWLICTILPGAVLIMGMVVFFRRRHL